MTKIKHNTREQWLESAVGLMSPLFAAGAYAVPRVRVACGWPHARGTSVNNRTLGQCWSGEAASDGVVQIFISPYLSDCATPQGVLATLIHEVCHAVVGNAQKHNAVFRKCAEWVGLEGKMTATNAGEALMASLKSWAEQLGEYPHAKLDLLKAPTPKQTTRMVKMECPHCGYVARTTRKWLDSVGAAHCPAHGVMEVEETVDE